MSTQTDTPDAHPRRGPRKNADNIRSSRNRRRDVVENDEYAAFTRTTTQPARYIKGQQPRTPTPTSQAMRRTSAGG